MYSIDFEEMYKTVIKASMYQILFALIAHFFWYIILMDTVTTFLNFGINVTVYMQLPTRYYDPNKIAVFRKTLYRLK